MAPRELSDQLEELTQSCVQFTKHPERRDDITNYIKRVALQKHRMERFWRDVEILDWEATASATSRTIDLSDIPRHRDILQIGVPKFGMLTKIPLDEVLASVTRGKTNCWYQLGRALHVKTAAPHTNLLIAMLGKPDTSDSKFYSWIAEVYEAAIIEEVGSLIFGESGQADKAKIYGDRVITLHNPQILREELLSENAAILSAAVITGDQ